MSEAGAGGAAATAGAKRARRKGTAAQGGVQDASSRERIHRAALARFARYGYDAVSLQEIADDVGLHKSSLFHHYASKSALLIEVFDDVVQRIFARLSPLQAADAPSRAVLFGTLDALVEHFCREPQAARLLLAVMTAPEDSPLRIFCGGRHDQVYTLVAAYLQRARRNGVIGRVNIRQAIPNVIGLLLMYPAVADDLQELVGEDPFSERARQIRKQELARIFRALFEA
jgi:AcrR family transcriptional regulator